ncbi:MAG TPA: metal-dependent hydrolase [Bacteroidetes bacterium]|nr:metal-dependent hydrolase [Bacteroidota bacterium]
MPTPVGHSLIGLILYYSFFKRKKPGKWITLFLIIFVSILPDFDFLPGILVREPNKFHHGFSHSFGFALLLTGFIYLIETYILHRKKEQYYLWFLILYSAHLIADYFAVDTRLPYGEPLFWPFFHGFFLFPYPFLLDVQRADGLNRFFPSLFSRHNLLTILWEIGFSLILWFAIKVLFKKSWRRGSVIS